MQLELTDLEELLNKVIEPIGNVNWSIPGGKWNDKLYSDNQIHIAKLIAQCVKIAEDHPND